MILCNSESVQDPLNHLRHVFAQLRHHQLYVKMEKCEFAQKEIMFLRHKIKTSQNGRKEGTRHYVMSNTYYGPGVATVFRLGKLL